MPDSKSGVPLPVPWVRIPPSPPRKTALERARFLFCLTKCDSKKNTAELRSLWRCGRKKCRYDSFCLKLSQSSREPGDLAEFFCHSLVVCASPVAAGEAFMEMLLQKGEDLLIDWSSRAYFSLVKLVKSCAIFCVHCSSLGLDREVWLDYALCEESVNV